MPCHFVFREFNRSSYDSIMSLIQFIIQLFDRTNVEKSFHLLVDEISQASQFINFISRADPVD
ncbi:hypothetical protein [Paenibacillus sp. HB172176]|uniref:hypothetical protein n=1 Tax=Paenibacillus sp. HB172176 TaxID=2493690 RepID=UPI001F0E6C47|nr:hypothetical protein [Paenibacillus sp. HB172176]